MENYNIHFLIALTLATFLPIVNLCGKRRWIGCFAVPLVSFILFYDQNMSLLSGWSYLLIGYVGSLFVSLFFCFLLTAQKCETNDYNSVPAKKTILLFIGQYLLLIIMEVVPWAVNTFPLADADTTMFALLAPIEGSNDFVIETLKQQVLLHSLIIFCVFMVFQYAMALLLRTHRIGLCFSSNFFLVVATRKNILTELFDISKCLMFFLLGCGLSKMLIIPSIVDSSAFKVILGKGIDISFEEESIDSPLYRNYYRLPKKAFVADSMRKKNLIVIFLESMANNYQRYTPELNEWKKRGLSFVPGGESIAGTSWTIAGITSSLCGLPLTIPVTKEKYKGELPTYLPRATCLMDLFKNQGYDQVFIQGSNADFTQKRQFWKVHGNVEILDELAFKAMGMVSQNHSVFWGIEDKKMLSFAKDKLSSMGQSDKPFAAYVLTVDTHLPEGYLDSTCHYTEQSTYQRVLRCSSFFLDDFLNWISLQPWFENTVVAVMGDHTTSTLSLKAGLSTDEKLYTMSFLLNVGKAGNWLNRKFSNLDYAPTILEAMGWTLDKHSFGLGRSLIASEPTLLEIFGRDSLESMIKPRSIQYDGFLFDSK